MYSLKFEKRQIAKILGGTSARFDLGALIHHAYHDQLTGLPNRFLFEEMFAQALHHAKRNLSKVAVIYIDLDGFKKLNDTYGHHFGDLVLKNVAEVLTQTIRETDILARFGGDEFVLAAEINSEQDLTFLLQRLQIGLRREIEKGLFMTASIGVAIYPDHAENLEVLLEKADLALYRAKRAGKDSYQIYD